MKKSIVLLCIATVCLLASCTKDNTDTSETKQTIEVSDQKTNQPEVKPFINMDQLEKYRMVSGSGRDYDKVEMERLSKNEDQKDYVKVIQHYVQQELKQEVHYLDSVDGTYNPREVVVGTKEGNTYLFSMRKWYDYNGIWTVYYHSPFKEDMTVPPAQTVKYELISDLSTLSTSVKKQVDDRISSKKKERSYIDDNGTIYALLVAPQGHSVELLNVFGHDSLIDIQYTTMETPYSFDGTTTTLMFGENPYILIKVNQSITEVSFTKYFSTENELIRLNML